MYRIYLRQYATLLACLLGISVVCGSGQTPPANKVPPAKSEAPKNPLLGRWKSDEAVIEIKDDGTITINADSYKYRVKGTVITVSNDQGSIPFPFELDGDTLTVEFQGRDVVYKRLKGDDKSGAVTGGPAAGEGVIAAFVGKWCYMSNLTGSNSSMSSRCFTLYANGTYEYAAESSTSGAYGSTAGQSYDSGRWTATRTTLTAYSKANGKLVYPIQLRNHPKTGDPMIVVNGEAYVTAYQKPPW